MVVTRQQAKTGNLSTKPRPKAPVYPVCSTGYTFLNESWEFCIVYPQRDFSIDVDGIPRPTEPADWRINLFPRVPPRTLAQKAAREDLLLWISCDTVDEYETQKQLQYEQNTYSRREFMKSQPKFHFFSKLPIELRLHIWALAMTEPMEATITCTRWRRVFLPNGSRGWHKSSLPRRFREYVAWAMLPPLLLVNHESHAAASKHYLRSFRGSKVGGGILSARPIILTIDDSILHRLIDDDDINLARDIIVDSMCEQNHFLGVNDGALLGALLSNPNLERLQFKCPKNAVWKSKQLLILLKRQYSQLRDANSEWVPPVVSILLAAPEGGDDIEFLLERNFLESLSVERIEPWPNAQLLPIV